jgi:hypothetical protein
MAKRTINKSDFIRTFPQDTSPLEIVQAAKAKGISFSANYVSTVRGASNKRAKKSGTGKVGRPKGSKNKTKAPAAAAGAVAGAGAVAVRTAAPSSSTESTFKKLVIELGMTRSKHLLDEVTKALAKIVG